MARTYDLDTWEKGTLVEPAQADLTTGIVTPAKYSGNTPLTPERLEYMSDSIRYLFTKGAASKDIFIGSEEEAPEDAKIIIDQELVNAKCVNVTNTYSESTQDSYACDYINNKIDSTCLYENSDGTTDNITLSEAPSGNYNFIEIYGISSDNVPCYIKIKSDDYTKNIVLSAFALDGSIYFKLARLSLRGTTLSFLQNSEFYKPSTTVNGGYTASGDFIKITKVIGYN